MENEESFAFKFYLARGVVSDIWIDNVVVRDLSGGGSNPLVGDRIEAENFDSQSGLYVSEGALNGCELNDWASYEDILLTGVKELRVHLASGGSVGNMEVRLGSTSGTLVATMPTVNTGGWTTYKPFTVPVAETTGTHDLYIVFKDRPSGGIMNVDWLELLGETSAVPVTGVSIVEDDPTIEIGQTLRLTTSFTPTSPDPPTNQVVTWASDDTDIAMVNANGDVTGIEEGTATITVTTEDGTFTDQVTVTVTRSGPGTYYATRLSGSPTEKFGLAKSLSVMPGDVVDIEVYVKYIDTDNENWAPLLHNLIAAISIPSGGIFIDGGQPGSLGNETLPFDPELQPRYYDRSAAPKAYLNYIIMDRVFGGVVDMGSQRISTDAREYGQNGEHERLFFDDILVREAGYMYIYISNEGEELVDVFFDDLKIEHVKSPVISTSDYYPFGLTFNSYSQENSVDQKYLYNGKEIQDALDLGWLDYGARMYQPEIARWNAIDRYSHAYYSYSPYSYVTNNPVVYIDLNGQFKIPIHRRITVRALDKLGFKDNSFRQELLNANTYLADIIGAGMDNHFDGRENFKEVYSTWNRINSEIKRGSLGDVTLGGPATTRFGILLHSIQDFYAHSNYIELFVDYYIEHFGSVPSSIEIPTFDEAVESPAYRTFRVDYLEKRLLTGEFNLGRYLLVRDVKQTNAEGKTHHNQLAKDKLDVFRAHGGTTMHDLAEYIATVHTMKVLEYTRANASNQKKEPDADKRRAKETGGW